MLSRGHAWTITIVAMLTMTVSYIDRQTLAVLAPTVTKALHLDETQYGLLTSAFSVAYLVATPLAGWWIDRAGARRGLVASLLVWSSIAALHAIVPGFGVLVGLRIALGLAEGPSFPGAAQTVRCALPPGDRARGYGLLFSGSSIGLMIAAPLASFMFVQVGWRAAFLGTAAVGMLWVPLWLLVTGMRGAPAQLDARGDLQARVPVLELLRHRLVLRGFVGVLAAALPATLFHGWGAKYLVRTFAVQQADIGHYLWVPPLAMDVGAILAGDLLSRSKRELEPPRVLFAIAALCAGGIGLLQLAATPWQGTAAIAIGTFGGGAMYSLVTGDLLRRVPPDQVSTVGGVLAGAQSLMLIVANLLVGVAVDAYGNYDLVASVTAAWVVPGALVWLVWRPIPFTRSGDPPG